MANSRELIETAADALDVPLPTVRQHMRNLRESGLITKGGRGIAAPAMTLMDAAKLILSLAASNSIEDGPGSIERLINLGRGRTTLRRHDEVHWSDYDPRRRIHLGLEPGSDAVADVASILAFFRDPASLLHQQIERDALRDPEIFATIEVEYPSPYVSITVGVRNLVSHNLTYGSRKRKGLQQVRRCREDALHAIARSFAT